MADLGNAQFYELNEGGALPPASPWWKQKKFIIIISVGILVIVAGLIIASIVIRAGEGTDEDIRAEADSRMAREAVSCEEATDKESCLAALRTRTARELGSAEVCDGLNGENYPNCITLIAQEKTDVSLCEALTAEAKVVCRDSVLLLVAQEKEDYGICKDISEEETRLACQALLLPVVIRSSSCATYGVDVSVCEEGERLNFILEQGVITDCETLQTETYRIDCEEIFRSFDSDGDGLSDADETLIHGTDPRNPDTDGDGFDDGTEVESGFNPRE